ncbi:MAG: hypothetical protein HQ580_15060 [Planctomycetes bacterium]|nr:hypothetical protein [Planctomycetota bacterium]
MGKKKQTKQNPALEDVINALQKSFSRVSSDSAKVSDSEALALIVGKVEFDIQIKLTPNSDRLLVDTNGVINLGLKGVIDTDIREESNSEKAYS